MIRSSECHIFEQMYAAQAEWGKFDFQNKLTHNQKNITPNQLKKPGKSRTKGSHPMAQGTQK